MPTDNSSLRELAAAYRAAHYDVDVPDGQAVSFKIDIACPPLIDVLKSYGVSTAAFITAYNPRSAVLCAAENEARHENLLHALNAQALKFLPGWGRDPTGRWTPERSVLVLGLSKAEGLDLARAYDQNAFVWIVPTRAPELIVAL